ncbi:MAG: acetyltransferase [Parasporobacterium sp.]|nr:acetyltransferase [Parasporobacterium sp.]
MALRKLLLIGGGGHCKSVLDSVLSRNCYDEIGIVDFTKIPIMGIPVVGNDDDLPDLITQGWTDAFVTVGSVGNTAIRRRLFRMITELGFHIPTIIDPSSSVANNTKIGTGCFLGKQTVLNSDSIIGDGVIINSGAVVEHDCQLGDFVHISPGATVCGQVSIGADTHIGAGAVVIQQINIGSDTVIGAGSIVVNHIGSNALAYGNPCKVIKK